MLTMEIIVFIFLIYFLYLILKLINKYYLDNNTFEEIPLNNSYKNLNFFSENKSMPNQENKINLNNVVGLKSVKDEMKYYFDFIIFGISDESTLTSSSLPKNSGATATGGKS